MNEKIQKDIDELCEKFRIPVGTYHIKESFDKELICVYGDSNRNIYLLRDNSFETSFLSKILDITLREALREELWKQQIRHLDFLKQSISNSVDVKIRHQIGVGFEDLSRLSNMTYEGTSLKAKIVIALSNSQSISKGLEFDIKDHVYFESKSFRTIRKFLEGCGERALFFCCDVNNNNFIMRGYIEEAALERIGRKCRLITIQYLGKRNWTFGDNSARPMYVENLELYDTQYTAKMVSKELRDRFGDINGLEKVIGNLLKQQHGTSIVFYRGDDINDYIVSNLYEKQRAVKLKTLLKLESIKTEDPDLLAISRIDGAFAVNVVSGTLSFFGAILEGKSIAIGDIGRGARYNTLKDFVESYNDGANNLAVAVVISSDGNVNILPTRNFEITKI